MGACRKQLCVLVICDHSFWGLLISIGKFMAVKLVLADQHPFLLLGVQQFLSNHKNFQIVDQCSTGFSALQALQTHQPCIFLTDSRLPDFSAAGLLREIRNQSLDVSVVILADTVNENEALELIRLGAKGIVLKIMQPDLLLRCLTLVSLGETWFEKGVMNAALTNLLKQDKALSYDILTDREMQLVVLIANGASNQKAAETLCISPGTVKAHMHRIYDKLNVRNRMGLSLLAREKGWI